MDLNGSMSLNQPSLNWCTSDRRVVVSTHLEAVMLGKAEFQMPSFVRNAKAIDTFPLPQILSRLSLVSLLALPFLLLVWWWNDFFHTSEN